MDTLEDEVVRGKTETSAPLSIKNNIPDTLSLTEIVPLAFPGPREETVWRWGEVVPGASAARRDRFPEPSPHLAWGKKMAIAAECVLTIADVSAA